MRSPACVYDSVRADGVCMGVAQAAIDESQHNVTGTVRCKLYKGNVIIEGRKSPYTIYNANLSTFGASFIAPPTSE
jgi:argininosuccinate synthase